MNNNETNTTETNTLPETLQALVQCEGVRGYGWFDAPNGTRLYLNLPRSYRGDRNSKVYVEGKRLNRLVVRWGNGRISPGFRRAVYTLTETAKELGLTVRHGRRWA